MYHDRKYRARCSTYLLTVPKYFCQQTKGRKHARVEKLVKQMKAEERITEELKATEQMKWIGLMNNVIIAAEEIVLRKLVYV